MVKLNKIYTKTGDDGTTGLVDGPRRQKDDLRVEAYGTVDETNAAIGLARLHSRDMARVDHTLSRIQNDLFDLGSDLATPGPDEGRQYKALRVTAKQVVWLEDQIDMFNEALEPLKSFVLPGGTPLSAALHLARTVARRAERIVVALRRGEPDINAEALRYLNRLSDLLFVLARVANANGTKDVLWEPGRHTGEAKSG
ncbi:cob(I)yrinic acid a,c-diamide adenosyltransferase [Pelagibacterium limicola]|uniref:cob(I)yrinic acid a,c-diamide adenosyltransferase n=1 Tax=Pelagibacterium limicola TaxID=2791022 RepID=UPI0018AF8A1B|nr:cob(I)yrinic acid a,c-diamide adenosyltransferase [Pelagibacterium limicola]